jgi:hypothetical protein
MTLGGFKSSQSVSMGTGSNIMMKAQPTSSSFFGAPAQATAFTASASRHVPTARATNVTMFAGAASNKSF